MRQSEMIDHLCIQSHNQTHVRKQLLCPSSGTMRTSTFFTCLYLDDDGGCIYIAQQSR